MEPSARKRWQPLANGAGSKPLERADPQSVATHDNRLVAHGKEGVDGSSPSEGLIKGLQIGPLAAQFRLEIRPFCATRMRREASRVSFLMCPFCVRVSVSNATTRSTGTPPRSRFLELP